MRPARLLPAAAVLVALLFASACGAHTAKSERPPPPTGKPLDAYLGEDDPGPPDAPDANDPNDAMVLHFIDVGQGAATLLEFPCGAVLIDTGGESNPEFDSTAALTAYLDAFFERRQDLTETIDLLVITHPHIDHTRGIDAVLKRYVVKNVIDNGAERDDLGGAPQLALHEWVRRMDGDVGYRAIDAAEVRSERGLVGPVIDPIGGCERAARDPEIRVLWGTESVDAETYSDNPNDHSVVMRVDYGEASALLPGDLQIPGLGRLAERFDDNPAMLDVDVYQVGHHGSRNATMEHQMKAMTPEIAVIPMGPQDRIQEWTAHQYGHPHQPVIELLRHPDYGVSGSREPVTVPVGIKGAWKERPSEWTEMTIDRAIYATGWDGTVRVTGFATGWLEVETEKQRAVTQAE